MESRIKATKDGNAAGLDNKDAELIKTDPDERTKELRKLFNKVKEEGVAPKSWNRGLIVRLPNKGDLHECKNWNIMLMYGIAEEFIELVKATYNNFEYVVRGKGETTEWYKFQLGVKQGCDMTGFFILLAIDWIMNRTTCNVVNYSCDYHVIRIKRNKGISLQ